MDFQDSVDDRDHAVVDPVALLSPSSLPPRLEDDPNDIQARVAVAELGERVPRRLMEVEEVAPGEDLSARCAGENVVPGGERRELQGRDAGEVVGLLGEPGRSDRLRVGGGLLGEDEVVPELLLGGRERPDGCYVGSPLVLLRVRSEETTDEVPENGPEGQGERSTGFVGGGYGGWPALGLGGERGGVPPPPPPPPPTPGRRRVGNRSRGEEDATQMEQEEEQ